MRRLSRRLLPTLLLPLLLLAAGCSLIPEHETPEIAPPQRWLADAAAPAVAPGTPVASAVTWPEPGWWSLYGSPTLLRLVAAAERGNSDLGAAAARVLQAEAQRRIAGADLLPGVDASGGASQGWSFIEGEDGSDSTGFNAELAASYQLDLFGRNRAALVSAEASALASRYDRDTVALTVVSNVATTYFQLLQFRGRLAVARRNLEIAEGVLRIVEARVASGAASPLELAQQRTAVANQRASIPPLETQASQTETALAILLGVTPGGAGALAGGLGGGLGGGPGAGLGAGLGGSLMAIEPPAVTPGLPSALLARRPDVQAAEARLLAAEADIGAARAAYFPNVELTGRGGLDITAVSAVFDPIRTSIGLVASLAQTVFDGGRIEGQVEFTEARRAELIQSYRGTVIQSFADVENALIALRKAGEQEALQLEALEQARLGYRLAEARYRAGAEDLLTVLDAQRSLYAAEDQLVQVRFARLQASVALFQALGGGWQGSAAAI
jgi:outer membrane protein TolC